jgi:hypothetical protein
MSFPTIQALFVTVVAQKDTPSAFPGIALASAVGKQFDQF